MTFANFLYSNNPCLHVPVKVALSSCKPIHAWTSVWLLKLSARVSWWHLDFGPKFAAHRLQFSLYTPQGMIANAYDLSNLVDG